MPNDIRHIPVTFSNFHKGGIIKDVAGNALDLHYFTDGNNVRFRNNGVSRIKGEVQIFADLTGSPRSLFLYPSDNNRYDYVYTTPDGEAHRIGTTAGGSANITTSVGATANPFPNVDNDTQWSGGAFTFSFVLNSGTGTPRGMTRLDTVLSDLPGWNYETGVTNLTAAVLRPFENILVAANLSKTISGAEQKFPTTIRWSQRAAPGAIPQNWEPTTQNIANELELNTDEEIVDMVRLGSGLVIFTSVNTFNMLSTGNTSTSAPSYRLSEVSSSRGLLSMDCAKEFYGKLFCFGRGDIWTFTGTANSVRSVIEGKNQDFLFGGDGQTGDIHPLRHRSAFVEHQVSQKEMWCYYVSRDHTGIWPNRIAIYNYAEDTWSFRDASNASGAVSGPIPGGGNSDTERPWPTNQYNLNVRRIVAADAVNNRLVATEYSYTFAGTAYTHFVEKEGITFQGIVKGGTVTPIQVHSIYPEIDGDDTSYTITLSGKNAIAGSYSATPSAIFNPAVDFNISPNIFTNRIHRIRFESNSSVASRISSYKYYIKPDGIE